MTVPDGAVIRASARFAGVLDQDIVNVWTMRTDFAAPQDDGDVFTGVNSYLSDCYVFFDDDIDADVTPDDLKVDIVQFLGGEWVVTQNVGFGPWGAAITPTGTDNALPPGDAACGFLYTDLGKHQGRKFFGGFTDLANSISGAITPAVQARILLGLGDILIPHVISAGNDLIAVVLDQALGVIRDVTGVGLNVQWSYQRRRRPGVGS